ncbi:MAG: molybdenum cofactor guanylyltransferase [Saprospiraceae bacterium]|jgi:molybdopterin-guanine dinucleotide biosynthesis protein A|nr:molybdenum cofactor guanylyltransferase [Saprospiraceae bacterium]MBP9209308.1 molybdenum cofactor guanylyltransferase [Saprospiraceae bacterium]MBV6474284.1 putative molybdenum cofactor guanylyltransferase [Saprospiraceae bacterium]
MNAENSFKTGTSPVERTTQTFPSRQLTAYILAGGKSRRMGTDKGMVQLGGHALISHAIRLLASAGLSPRIVANDDAYLTFGCPVLHDLIPGKGPMGGLFTALSDCPTPQVLLASCDMPMLTNQVLERMISRAGFGEIVCPTINSVPHPLFSLYPVALADRVGVLLREDRLRMLGLIAEVGYSGVGMDDLVHNAPEVFANVNSPEDLKMLQEKWMDNK